MKSIRDLVRQERQADIRQQYAHAVATDQTANRTYDPIDRGIYEGWRRSWELIVLLCAEPLPALSNLFKDTR